MKSPTLGKGHIAEELLRAYFSKAGYYAIRGVPFVYEGFDVTDIDLWLYSRASSVSREITIVDAKNKKTPQAIERIFWVHGLKTAVKATSAIVATTDKRPEVKNFGKQLDVVVLDGAFLARLGSRDGLDPLRLSDEELSSSLDGYTLGKLDGDWKGRIKTCKGLLSKGLSFDSCNYWLEQGRFFAGNASANVPQRENALRCMYLICSFITIAIDYLLRDLSFLEQTERCSTLDEGFKYGSRGRTGVKKVLEFALGLVEEHATDGTNISRQVRSSIDSQLSALQTDILSQFFSKPEVARSLFSVAKEFEGLAMQRKFSGHGSATVELRGVLYCFMDHWSISRKSLSGV
ncbi:hypothetical protein HBR94_22155 [Pseudomonas sp. WS 5412]|uniref:hypothetical protein n=1 Tax=Pseudomonas sp. WS 5412 TaxID=2717487 RepID=UPI00147372DA|nr:hypothetical protein [Pseudomonas sp. WS 5412]NMY34209.1 hypothetical protein [Pseudomonas sp. WS 5412]